MYLGYKQNYMTGIHHHKKAFTLVEMLVAVFIFSLIVIIVASMLVNAIRVQRYNLAHRELMDQTSFVMEYMSRHIRMAKTATTADCLSVGDNYDDSNGIKFLHYRYITGEDDPELACTEFSESGGRLREEVQWIDIPGGYTRELTSGDLDVVFFNAQVDPGREQPLVQINLRIAGREDTELEIQTKISQRDLNF